MDTLSLPLLARMTLGLVVVLALVGGMVLLFRHYRHKFPGMGKTRRLQVVESFYLDPKNRFVLVKCDAQEHVILMTPTHSLVIQSTKGKEKTV